MRGRPLLAALTVLGALGCAGDGGGGDLPVIQGLALRARGAQYTPGPHLGQLLPHGDVIYVANSFDSLAAWAFDGAGGLTATLDRPWQAGDHRCTTLAVHAPSRSLYCSSDERTGIRVYDLTDRHAPAVRIDRAPGVPELYARSIHIAGDQLYVARFDEGLLALSIGADGSFTAQREVRLDANVRFVDGEAPLVALTSDRGLLVLADDGAEVSVLGQLPLDGPPLDLRVVGDTALVALGSAGVAVVDISGSAPRLARQVVPEGVVTSADLHGDALAVTTLTAAFVYDLSAEPPRLAGFFPSGGTGNRDGGVMLHARFVDGDLVVSDWVFVERYAVDLAGHVVALDAPRGLYLRPDAPVTFPVANRGDLDLWVEVAAGEHTEELLLRAGATAEIVLPVGVLDDLRFDRGRIVGIATRARRRGEPLWESSLRVVRTDDEGVERPSRPAAGDAFPELTVADDSETAQRLPTRGVRQRIVSFTPDCVAMWPALEDMAWLARSGQLDEGATPIFLTKASLGSPFNGFATRWGLDGALRYHYGDGAPPEVVDRNGTEDVYEDLLWLSHLPRAAHHPTDYVVDVDGTVEVVETYYRGAHPVRSGAD